MPVLTAALEGTAGAIVEATVERQAPRPHDTDEDAVPGSRRVRLLIDTGASHTAMRAAVLAELGLRPTEPATFMTPSHRDVQCGRYEVRLRFAPGVAVDRLAVFDAPLEGHLVDGLLGRDVIGLGLFVFHGPDARWTLAF